ncbi:MAG: hypothetical protein M1431_08010 [Candidatus Thermoplasmatota archaeon]|nr:hypothetical protein [Candidatus Thermoplasmatota archaeon]
MPIIRTCKECHGSGYADGDHPDICPSCMGVGRFYDTGGDGRTKIDLRRTNIIILLIGMILISLVMASGQIRIRVFLMVLAMYVWAMMLSVESFFIYLGKTLSRILL